MEYVEHVIDLVGNTPLVKLNALAEGVSATVLAKVEYFNPGGSVKDRIALRMIEAAEASGELKPGGTIVEPTSGNTGVGLAMVAQRKGYKCVFVCPDKVSEDKRNALKAYGAEVVVCPTAVAPEHPDSYYNVSDRLVTEIDGAWKPDQYSNPENPESHYRRHRARSCGGRPTGRITHFVAGVGTGGTISGTGRYLKEVSDGRVKIVGADPEGSVYSGGSGRPVPGRGRRRGLLAGHLRPRRRRRDHRGVRRGVVRRHPAARPRGGAAGRRLLRDGGRRRDPAREAARAGRRGGRAAARRRPRLPVEGVQRRLDGLLRLPAAGALRRDRRRRAAPQGRGRRDAGPRARAPERDRRRRGGDPA